MPVVQSIDIARFVEESSSRRPILLAGAGISFPPPSNLPLARTLIDAFQAALQADSDVGKLFSELPPHPLAALSSPELLYNAVADYSCDLVLKLFRAALAGDRPNANHWIIARLLDLDRCSRVITTNFDSLLEGSLRGSPYSLRLESEEPRGGSELWKIHGDLRDHMAIALSDVALLGFSVLPLTLKAALAEQDLVVAGYSGNDAHVVRAIMDARPLRVWWIVRSGETPGILEALASGVRNLSIVEGDLACTGPKNPLVDWWQKVGKDPLPSFPDSETRSENDLADRLGRIFANLLPAQKGFVLHSLLRRSGTKTSLAYRQQLSRYLLSTMFQQGFSPGGLAYAKDNDWVDFFERLFVPRVYARPAVLRRHGIAPDDPEDHRELKPVEGRPGSADDAAILLETGLEKVFHGSLERGRLILEAARRCAESAQRKSIRIQACEALSWVHLRLGAVSASDREHGVFLEEIERVRRDLAEIESGPAPGAYDRLLQGYGAADEPPVYRTLAIDRRWRSHVSALRLSARLRLYGRPDLALKLIDGSGEWRLPASAYTHALRGFCQLERARCLLLTASCDPAIAALDAAESELGHLETQDYESLRQFHRLAGPLYIKIGRFAKTIVSILDERRVV